MKKPMSDIVFNFVNAIIMLLLCVITLYPYLNQLAVALNAGSDTAFGGITIFPRKFTTVNFEAAFLSSGFTNAIFISVARVIAGTALSLTITVLCAYVLSKKDIPFRRFIMMFFLIPVFIHAGIIPNYILFRYLGVLNTFWVYILPGMFVFFNMVVMRTYIEGLPKSLDEAALIDGANELQVLLIIYLPLCLPMLATIALWLIVGNWNDWITTLMYVNKNELFTVQYILMQVVKESETVQKMATEMAMNGQEISKIAPTPDSVKAATLMIATLPIVAVYPFLQKYFVKGVTVGAVKE